MDFTSFQHSLFLASLGNAILNSLWQGFILWVIYETVLVSYKNASAKFKHNLSVLLLVCSFTWFISSLVSGLVITQKITSPAVSINRLENTTPGSIPALHKILSFAGSMVPYLSVAYILLLFFLMVKLFTAYRQVHFAARNHLINPPFYLESFASKVASQLKIPKTVKVWISNHIEVPSVIGYIKPVILIPFASVNNLTVDQLEAIILHELSHIKRNDYLVNLFVSVIETVLFFNPFVTIFIKIIRRERENCCDDFVLQYQYDPHSYASALLRLEQLRQNNLSLSLGAVSGKKQLLSRIKRITGSNPVSHFNYGQKLLALLITTGMVCSLAWLSSPKTRKGGHGISSTTKMPQKFDPQLIVTGRNTRKETAILINKTNEEKIKSNIKIKKYRSNDSTLLNGQDKKNNFFDKKFLKEFLPLIEKRPLATSGNNFQNREFKKLPQIENLEMSLTGEINKGLKEAYEAIDKINWRQVHKEISKSLSEIRLNELSPQQRAEIAKARKYLSIINLDQQPLNVAEMMKKIRGQQKRIIDSLRAEELLTKNEWKDTNLGQSFNFDHGNESNNQNDIKKNKIRLPNEPRVESNGRKFKIAIQEMPFPNGVPSFIQETREWHRIIVEI